jgi:hypothetical protein
MNKYLTPTYIAAKFTECTEKKALLYATTTIKDAAILYDAFYNEVSLDF